MEKVRPWCGQSSDRGRLKNRTEQNNNYCMWLWFERRSMTPCVSLATASPADLVNINAYSYSVIRETAKPVLYPAMQKLFIFRRRGYVGLTSRDTVYNHGLTSAVGM